MIRRSWLNRVAAVVLAVLFAAMPAVALAGDPIDVGAAATDRASAYSILFLSYTQKTLVSGTNPANDAGTIDTVEVWFNLKDGDAYASVATFTDNGSNSLTANDSEEIGSPASGSKQTVTGLDIDIDSGEYIGIVGHTDDDSGKYSIEFDYNSASSTTWFYNGDATSGTNTFNTTAGSETDMSLYGTGETAGGTPDISNTPSTENLGIVGASTTVYAKGSSPSNPVGDSDCTFTVTNNSGAAVNIDIKGANWTGGVGWTLTSGPPGSNETRITAYYSGQNPASGVVLTTSDQSFISSLADSATKKWDFKVETGTFTDGVQKSTTITLTAALA